MPISEQELERRFLVAPGASTIGELCDALDRAATVPEYVLVRLDGGRFGAMLPHELGAVAALIGRAALGLRLDGLPGFGEPAGVVAHTAAQSRAEDEREAWPTRRVVVLRDGEPIGLLTDETRAVAGFFSRPYGQFRALFEEAHPDKGDHMCPACLGRFDVPNVLRGPRGVLVYACPHPNCSQPLDLRHYGG